MADEILVAKTTFTTTHDGERVVIKKDKTRVRAGHPIAERNPQHFKALDVHFDVETARSEPVVPSPTPPAPAAPPAPPARKRAASKRAAQKAGDE